MKDPHLVEEIMGDEIIAEVRAIRDALAAKFNYDLDLLFEEARRQKRNERHKDWKASPKRLISSSA